MLRHKFFIWGTRLIQRGAWYLTPLSLIYQCVIFLRNKAYDWGLFKITKVRPLVVSVGNIRVGGTGKTPFVCQLAKAFSHRKIAILSRGYGPFPDEAVMLAQKIPNARILVGKDRAFLAKQIEDVDLIFLDDGLQYRKLFRNIEIILTDGRKDHFLPRGFLRDSPKRLQKADAVFVKGKDFQLHVQNILDRKRQIVSSIRGWKVFLFSAIADPQSFRKTVEELGAIVVGEKIFADHAVPALHQLPPAKAYICTEKDFVKLKKTHLPIYFLQMELQWAYPESSWEKLIEKINQKIDNHLTYES